MDHEVYKMYFMMLRGGKIKSVTIDKDGVYVVLLEFHGSHRVILAPKISTDES
ncbi:hypothetical protein LCGC14_1867270 [marine sediment metagenome]|uniref:Uncharacterized protein n=1 Tax=marine sediment metagenome TaxID=412755 RepID=A0A0F9IK32_9ZZZZ